MNKDLAKVSKATQFVKGVKHKVTRKGSANLKTKAVKQVYADILGINHVTGKNLTYKQMIVELKALMWKHSMVAKHILEGYFGKPAEHIVQDIQAITIHTDKPLTKDISKTITVDTDKGTVDTSEVYDNSNAQSPTDDRDI